MKFAGFFARKKLLPVVVNITGSPLKGWENLWHINSIWSSCAERNHIESLPFLVGCKMNSKQIDVSRKRNYKCSSGRH